MQGLTKRLSPKAHRNATRFFGLGPMWGTPRTDGSINHAGWVTRRTS